MFRHSILHLNYFDKEFLFFSCLKFIMGPRTQSVPGPLVFARETFAQFLPNKKVLLRERKRHTAYHVASVCSAVLSWSGRVPHPDLTGGMSHPDLSGGTPSWGPPS